MTDSIWYSYECSFPLGICKNVYPKQKSVKKKSVTPAQITIAMVYWSPLPQRKI